MAWMGKRLEPTHHKVAVLVLSVLVFAIGVIAGARLRDAAGESALFVLLFGISFLCIALHILLFTQLVHLREDLALARDGPRKKGK